MKSRIVYENELREEARVKKADSIHDDIDGRELDDPLRQHRATWQGSLNSQAADLLMRFVARLFSAAASEDPSLEKLLHELLLPEAGRKDQTPAVSTRTEAQTL